MDTDDLPGRIDADVVVVGGGLAGLWAVLHMPEEWHIFVVDKERGPDAGSSPWAQGGMAVATAPEDSPDLHAADTIEAGAGACSEAAVRVLVEEAPRALDGLLRMGCAFDANPDGSLHLNREGGQSVARSVHAADATGREIMRVVVEWAKPLANRIVGSASRLLVSDGRCIGVEVATDHGEVAIMARCVLLATGGCSALYAATTNPETATGDGIALALRVGAEVADLEFVQFHPTALAVGGHRRVLLTEALRGDGAIVVDDAGKRFLFDHHPDGELAPRDVVARAVAQTKAFLDARPIGAAHLRERFPNVVAAVASQGFDLATQPVPIEPAAHYVLGGVVTDLDGRTSVPGLYAAGECAATGVHGANRMAGNSLAEAVVFGRRAAIAMGRDSDGKPAASDVPAPEAPAGIRAFSGGLWDKLRGAMSDGAGLVRTEGSLQAAEATARTLVEQGDRALSLAATAAAAVCRSARLRKESRGVHHRADAPERDRVWDGARVVLQGEVEEDS